MTTEYDVAVTAPDVDQPACACSRRQRDLRPVIVASLLAGGWVVYAVAALTLG